MIKCEIKPIRAEISGPRKMWTKLPLGWFVGISVWFLTDATHLINCYLSLSKILSNQYFTNNAIGLGDLVENTRTEIHIQHFVPNSDPLLPKQPRTQLVGDGEEALSYPNQDFNQ